MRNIDELGGLYPELIVLQRLDAPPIDLVEHLQRTCVPSGAQQPEDAASLLLLAAIE